MILTHNQLALENSLRRILPAGVVSCWIPDGYGRAKDIIRGYHGTCFGTHPNVEVIQQFGPNLLTDGGLEEWDDATHLTYWGESLRVNREATDKIEGLYSARLDVDAGNTNTFINQVNVPLTPSRRCKLRFRYKNSLAGKTAGWVFRDLPGGNVFLKADGTWNAGNYQNDLSNSTAWKEVEIEFNAHADYSNYHLELKRIGAASSSIYWDKVSIEEITPSVNPSVGWVTDAVDDYVLVPDVSSLNFGTEDFSIVIWANIPFSGSGNNEPIIGKGYTSGAPAHGWAIVREGVSSNAIRYYDAADVGGSWNATLVSGALSYGWHRVVVTRKGNVYCLYVDASEKYSQTKTAVDLTNAFDLMLCTNRGLTELLGISFALPAVVKGAWSQAQVTNDWLATRGLFAPRG